MRYNLPTYRSEAFRLDSNVQGEIRALISMVLLEWKSRRFPFSDFLKSSSWNSRGLLRRNTNILSVSFDAVLFAI